jgi:transposase
MMSESEPFELRSRVVGALPIVDYVLARLRLPALLEQHLPPPDSRLRLLHATSLGAMLRNVVLGKWPLYGMSEWARRYEPSLLGLDESTVELLNDDRAGRALDVLFDADRASLTTATVVSAINEFHIDLDEVHNDSTSITFSGQYALATGRRLRGKQALAITHGHNKDHRPDLKQLLWILTVSADGSVPVHYRVCDGNTSDDPTHIATWDTIRKLVGRPDFLYVADCKLCTRQNLDYIAGKGGRFITVLPRSRKEDAWFREHVQTHELSWTEVVRRPNRRRRDGEEDVWRAVDSPVPSAEGYRIVWVWSHHLAEQQKRSRLSALQKAYDAITALDERLRGARTRFKTRAAVEVAVQRVLSDAGVERWADVDVIEEAERSYKQEGPGRPGPNTRYVSNEQQRFRLEWKPKADAIAYDAHTDGMYPLITNCTDLPGGEILAKYKYQPYLEKRHEQLKSVSVVAPAFLKNEGRVESLLLLHFVALLVHALIERQLRKAMDARDIDALPLYPEERDCRAPTSARILEIFETVQRHELLRDGRVVQRFEATLTPLQEQVLDLLGIPAHVYLGWPTRTSAAPATQQA